MTLKIIYFVHGTTTDNQNDIATGWFDGELSGLGKKQSIELGSLLVDRKFDAVFCSDLKRAVDSAKLTFGKRYSIIKDERLREANYGRFNGKKDEFKERLKEHIHNPFPDGESYTDVEKRVSRFLSFLKSKYDGKVIAIVAHQAPQLALEVLTKGKTWEQAIDDDWRKTKSWQPGWEYTLV